MTNTLTSVEKFHSNLLSPASSTDTTVIERAQHLSSFHDQLKITTQVKQFDIFFWKINFFIFLEKNE